ncbi:MAG: hypothetical protein HY678_03230 [Chloroflexi bacterium]|nr:hypothetical protein [Chloroflexota bacterium]
MFRRPILTAVVTSLVLAVAAGLLSARIAAADPESPPVYVLDSLHARIQKFTSGGLFVLKWGSLGKTDGKFDAPHGIATDPAGNVYVADLINHRIQKFTSAGKSHACQSSRSVAS